MPTEKPQSKPPKAASRRAKNIVEQMLSDVERVIENPVLIKDDDWKNRYGDKANMVLLMQKLVQTLSALPENKKKRKGAEKEAGLQLSPEDVLLLVAWLKERG